LAVVGGAGSGLASVGGGGTGWLRAVLCPPQAESSSMPAATKIRRNLGAIWRSLAETRLPFRNRDRSAQL